jgi:hypothetical protein
MEIFGNEAEVTFSEWQHSGLVFRVEGAGSKSEIKVSNPMREYRILDISQQFQTCSQYLLFVFQPSTAGSACNVLICVSTFKGPARGIAILLKATVLMRDGPAPHLDAPHIAKPRSTSS